MVKILLTTTSFQDTPGPHHALLESLGAEIHRERGPLSEAQMLELAGDFDAFLCGDDVISQAVIDKSLPRLKLIAKYGIGVDKIDVAYASKKGIPLSFCPGVNHTTVAEHTFALLLALKRNLVEEVNYVAAGQWKRLTGHEIMGQTIGIIGLGRIGREVATRARAFGLNVIGFDLYWPEEFAAEHKVQRVDSIAEVLKNADIISLHTNLTPQTENMINAESLKTMRKGAVVLNCARGELVDSQAMADALNKGEIGGYGTDVLDKEPPAADHPLIGAKNCIITPHIGSRTYESVVRQAMMATQNLVNMLHGEKPLAQVNTEVAIPPALIQK